MTDHPFRIYNRHNVLVGERRTENDANALVRRLLVTNAKDGPYRVEDRIYNVSG